MLGYFKALSLTGKLISGAVSLLVIASLFGGVIVALHRYRHAAYEQGVNDTDNEWNAADAKLRNEAANSASQADDAWANRAAAEHATEADDRKAVQNAEANGSSPLDALFGGGAPHK